MKILDVPQSGSVGGITSSRNRYGQYRRSRSMPTNPNSSRQQIMRGYFAQGAQAWRGLTAEQRLGWITLAGMVTITDSLGQASHPSGFQLFTGCYSRTKLIGQGPLSDPPGAIPAVEANPCTGLAAAAGAGTVTLSRQAVGADSSLVIEASPPLSGGAEYNSDYRFLKYEGSGTAGPSSALGTLYVAKFGPLAAGQKIFVRAYHVVEESGFAGAVQTFSAVVAA